MAVGDPGVRQGTETPPDLAGGAVLDGELGP